MEAKLNQLCEKCSRIADHVPLFQKSCSIGPDNPTVHWINHHESSTSLVTSARAGCHLCTLLLAEIKMPMMEDMQAQELAIMDKQAGSQAQPIYQIKLCGYLQRRRFGRKRDIIPIIMKPFKRSAFEWSGFDRLVSIDIVPQVPHGGTRYQVAGDAHIWTYTTARLFIEHQAGKSMINCDGAFCSTSLTANDIPSQRLRLSWPRSNCNNCVAIFVRDGSLVAS